MCSRCQRALLNFCCRYALAIDYTGRNLQDHLKAQGYPWTKAKGFDDSCPIGPFIPSSEVKDPHALQLWLKVDAIFSFPSRSLTSRRVLR